MRVFVTGASGFVGSAVVRELIAAGHQVLGLARSEASARVLEAAGAAVHAGDLEDHSSLQSGIAAADGVIHCGFIHDFSRFEAVCEIDRQAVRAMGAVLQGTDRPFVVTSGIALLRADDRVVVETDQPLARNPRRASEEAADEVAATGVRVSVLRLPPSVHDLGDGGFVPMLFDMAKAAGRSVYTGDGGNCWPAVHRIDAARLYRLALETAAAPGTRYHAVGDAGIPFREIAGAVARQAGVPLEAVDAAAAAVHFGGLAHFTAMNVRASAARTAAALGWQPEHISLMEDIDRPAYFEGRN